MYTLHHQLSGKAHRQTFRQELHACANQNVKRKRLCCLRVARSCSSLCAHQVPNGAIITTRLLCSEAGVCIEARIETVQVCQGCACAPLNPLAAQLLTVCRCCKICKRWCRARAASCSMQITILQYHVGSRTSAAEIAKQQLVQSALQQGLCDLALLQGCSGILEPVRAGVGAVFHLGQGPPHSRPDSAVEPVHTGVMLCYRADRFQARQVPSPAQDLPGYAYTAVQLQDMQTMTRIIALAVCLAAPTQGQFQQPSNTLTTALGSLMRQLSTSCPVIAAGEVTVQPGLQPLTAQMDQQMQISLCPGVNNLGSTSQAFFAAACTAEQQVSFSNMQSLLPRPAAHAVQHTQNATTVDCQITFVSTSKGTADLSSQQASPDRADATTVSMQREIGTSARLQGLIAAAATQVSAGP